MRLIDADALIPLIKMGEMNTYDDLGRGRNGGIDFAIERIKQMPTIEPERKKGKWILVNGKTSINCSYCYHCSWSLSFEDTVRQFNFCPSCGAEMRGAEK